MILNKVLDFTREVTTCNKTKGKEKIYSEKFHLVIQ